MNIERREYGLGTSLTQSYPWATYRGGSALCSDGRVRKLHRIALTPDTFFSIPASVKAAGKTVSGYVTIQTVSGSDVPDETDPYVVYFVAYEYGKNHTVLPTGLDCADYPKTAVERIEQAEELGRMPSKADCLAYLTQCADRQGRHYAYGSTVSPEDCPNCEGTNVDNGYVPCSRYGSRTSDCAEVAYRVAYVFGKASGEVECWLDSLDWAMGLVVNDSDGVAELIREYGHRHYR